MAIAEAVPAALPEAAPEAASEAKESKLCFLAIVATVRGLINIRLVNPLQACTLAGGRFSVLHIFPHDYSGPSFADVVLFSIMQGSYLRLFRTCLYDYGVSFRNVLALDNPGDDHHRSDGDGSRKSGIAITLSK